MNSKQLYYRKNADSIKAKRKVYIATMRQEQPELYLYSSAQQRARRKGIPFSIQVQDIIIPEFCPILGIQLMFGADQEHAPSLDKINNLLGYIPGNVQVISYRANRIKNDASAEELKLLAKWVNDNL